MSKSFRRYYSKIEEFKKEVEFPDINQLEKEALEEIDRYPNESDKKIAMILVKQGLEKIRPHARELQKFFESQPTKPVKLLNKIIKESDNTIEKLDHNYTPPPVVKGPDEKHVEEKDLKKELGKESYRIVSELDNSGVKSFDYNDVYNRLPDHLKQKFKLENLDTYSGMFSGIRKAMREGKVRKVSRPGVGKKTKFEILGTFTKRGLEIVKSFETGEKISRLDIYRKLPPEMKSKYPENKQRTHSLLFYVLKRAREDGLIEETEKRINKRKIYKRV